ncbi:MAG: hypothetical protein J7641_23665 [Cyanobacteria bacterium SID2]|nr:hypothetical protein [Cyanobacteria bacterium SID2]
MNPLILSILFTSIFFLGLRLLHQNKLIWVLLLLSLLPVFLVYLWNPDFRIYAWHGFMHTSIVYQIRNGIIPPSNPLLAGEPLLYPWGSHVLVAGLSSILNLSPPNVFVLLNICYLLLTLILVFKISTLIASDRIAGIFAAFLAIFGITFVNGSLFDRILRKITFISDIKIDRRPIPPFGKFVSSGANNQCGIFLFTLFLYSILQISLNRSKVKKIYYFSLFASTSATAFFYPLYLPALIASGFTCCIVLCLARKKQSFVRSGIIVSSLILSTAVVFPYLYQISANKSEAAQITLAILEPGHLLRNTIVYFSVVFPVLIITIWRRKAFLKIFHTQPLAVSILLAVAATTASMYIFIRGATTSVEYKYLILGFVVFSILSSISFRDLYLKNQLICFCLITSFLLPLSSLILKISSLPTASDRYIDRGIDLLHGNPDEEDLYAWMRKQTQPDSIFIDSSRKIPVFGQRQLYLGIDSEEGTFSELDGWWSSTQRLLIEQGYPRELIERRQRLVDVIYSKDRDAIEHDTARELIETAKRKNLYIVSRDREIDRKLLASQYFDRVYTNRDISVYQLIDSQDVFPDENAFKRVQG